MPRVEDSPSRFFIVSSHASKNDFKVLMDTYGCDLTIIASPKGPIISNNSSGDRIEDEKAPIRTDTVLFDLP